GVNAGAFVAANLANQMTPAQMCRIFVRNEADVHPFHPQVFYKPAFEEYMTRAKRVPSLVAQAILSFLRHPNDQSLLEALTILTQAVPAGVFDNEGFHQYLSSSYSSIGRTNDFARLSRELRVIATDLESGETVRFGDPDQRSIPISRAIQASMAAPGLYTPVHYGGRYYLDGTLNKGMHTSVALENGADVVLAINPVVPVDARAAVAQGTLPEGALTHSGMPNILSQTYRAMVTSRLQSGLRTIARDYPKAKVHLFQPNPSDVHLFFKSVFSFHARKVLCEQAYQITRQQLRERLDELAPSFEQLGISVREEVLHDQSRNLKTGLYIESVPYFRAETDAAEETGVVESISQRSSALLKRAASWI
ncbi:MAG: patatin-like phospholipase family protein, partial [Oleiphilaceae bacterium]|nr:patatin-like phospholipase family protein [Oleiphilaceae bacterium]